MENGAALFVTEWGTINSDGKGDVDEVESQKWLDFMEEYHISHAKNWNAGDLGERGETSSIVQRKAGIDGLKNNQLTEAGFYIKDKILAIAASQNLSTENFNLNGEKISLFPNPASSTINIATTKTKITSVAIVDMQGGEVLSDT